MSDHILTTEPEAPTFADRPGTSLTRRRLVLAGSAWLASPVLSAQAAAPSAAAPASASASGLAADRAAGPASAQAATAATCVAQPVTKYAKSFILGADVSTLDVVERGGGRFSTADGRSGTALQILRVAGIQWARLRLWHTPINATDVVEGDRIISRHGDRSAGGTTAWTSPSPWPAASTSRA